MSRGLAPFAATAALLLAGCEVYAVPDPLPCPGVQKGVFDFSGTQILDPLPTCYFAQPGSSIYQVNNPMNPFQGTIAFDGDAAALCVGNAHAAINVGTHGGTPDAPTIDVFYPEFEPGTPVSVAGCSCPSAAAVTASGCSCPSSSPTSNCSCPALLRQNTQGALIPRTGGFSGFTGVMINTVKFRVGLSPDLACDCLRSGPVGPTPAIMECAYSYTLTATSVGSR